MQSAVEEVGRALKSHRAAIVLWEDGTLKPEGMSIYERAAENEEGNSEGGPKGAESVERSRQ